ncbi:RuvC-like resolvase [Streptomyces phage Wakanda]|uniref:RuvC-like resolvase n=2 Tax=Wakandavirus TaxID=3044854 RepID=A0A6G8R378_9CAUD|nr:RuvC-like resolvase [Streptomyces phage Wakanda]YP_010652381.1 RuvC-like resolvase [Streptomyces phage Muntaha]QIN94061.1 RuvC-like resolvase [Streptomyces phage Wakanda]QIN94626.1 RuvC-like resolvase [Streptomyces phage Muntaha]
MGLGALKKTKASKVMGIDCSTHALAFTVFYNRRPIHWGKIVFEGADVFERLSDAADKLRAVKDEFDVDYIAFEGAIMAKVKNPDVTIKLAMVYGACIAELMRKNVKVVTVKPLEWQSYIGNPNFKKAEKDALKLEFPGKSVSWYSTKIREIRKQRTMDFFNKKWPHMALTDNDVGDSAGIAYFAYYTLTSR